MHIVMTVEVSYETAWIWLHKICNVMTRRGRSPLIGSVEFDEAYSLGLNLDTSRCSSPHFLTVVHQELEVQETVA